MREIPQGLTDFSYSILSQMPLEWNSPRTGEAKSFGLTYGCLLVKHLFSDYKVTEQNLENTEK